MLRQCSTCGNDGPILRSHKRCSHHCKRTKQEIKTLDVPFENFKKERISNQLKIEKDIFPNCIQAVNTYCNKRKSLCTGNTKNRYSYPSIFPGEMVTPITNMNKSIDYVQQWLEKNENEQRLPLANLDVNSPKSIKTKPRTLKTKVFDENSSNITLRKRTISKDDSTKVVKRKKLKLNTKEHIKKRKEEDHLSITSSPEEIIIDNKINVSPSIIDKDKEACMAVLVADKLFSSNNNDQFNNTLQNKEFDNKSTEILSPSILQNECSILKQNNKRVVPFYLKGKFVKTKQNNVEESVSTIETAGQSKKVSVFVETEDLKTTIQISNCENKTIRHTCSHSVQTDTETLNNNSKKSEISEGFDINSDDIFTEEIKSIDMISNMKHVAEPSNIHFDTDSESDVVTLVTTVADVHVNKLQSSILHPKKDTAKAAQVPRKRRYIPSSDSSEKENRDPNVKSKRNKDKKTAKKKKSF